MLDKAPRRKIFGGVHLAQGENKDKANTQYDQDRYPHWTGKGLKDIHPQGYGLGFPNLEIKIGLANDTICHIIWCHSIQEELSNSIFLP